VNATDVEGLANVEDWPVGRRPREAPAVQATIPTAQATMKSDRAEEESALRYLVILPQLSSPCT